MINIDPNIALYISFDLEPADYVCVPIASAYYSSVSLKKAETAMKRLNYEPTIEMLLRRTPSELMNQRSFGTKTNVIPFSA